MRTIALCVGLLLFVSACSDSKRPSLAERQPNGEKGTLTGTPCDNQGAPIAIAGELIGHTTANKKDPAGPRGANFQATLIGVRHDHVVIDFDGALLKSASNNALDIKLQNHSDYDLCTACVTLALDGNIGLIAVDGTLSIKSYVPGKSIDATLSNVVFRQMDSQNKMMVDGCTLQFQGPATLQLTPDPTPPETAPQGPELGSMTLDEILTARINGSLPGLLAGWAGYDLASWMQSASVEMWNTLEGWAEKYNLNIGGVMEEIGPTATYLVLYGLSEFVPLF